MPIHQIVSSGNIAELLSEIKKNPLCIYSINKDKQSPLHIAASLGHNKIIHILLLQANQNYNEKSTKISVSSYINLYDIIGHDAVICALVQGHIQCFKKLLALSNIEQTNNHHQTILNYILLSVDHDKIKPNYNPYEIVAYILKQGANPNHNDKSPVGTYLNYVKVRKLPLIYWHIFLYHGAGICFDFALLGLNPGKKDDVELLEKITANQIILGTWKGAVITRDFPGFSNAITNLQEVKEFIAKGHIPNFKYLFAHINFCLKHNTEKTNKPITIHPELIQIAQCMACHLVPSLKEIAAKKIKFFQDNMKKTDMNVKKLTPEQDQALLVLPDDLKDYLKEFGVNVPLVPVNNEIPSKKSS